jgi:menaquinone-dependent protoporphyrinogen IX oxidase
VAGEVAAELNRNGQDAVVKKLEEVSSVKEYDAVVVGGPMIFGWQQPARNFIHRFEADLAVRKVTYFACAMRLTDVPGEKLPNVPLTLDPSLAAAPVKAGSLSFKERFSTTGYYLRPMLAAAPSVKPLNVAFFNGKLDMRKLAWWQAAFVMIVVQGVPGDYRDFDQIRVWAKSLSALL